MPLSLTKEALLEKAIADGKMSLKLYKYRGLGKKVEDIITKASLWLPSPDTFNDPFDFAIVDNGQYSSVEIRTYLRQNGMSAADIRQILAGLRKHPDQLLEVLEAAKQRIFTQKGVLCLSVVPDSILMWSHYAEGHQGLALEFDVAQDLDFFLTPVRVKYVDKYPVTRFLVDNDAVEKTIRTKSSSWSYEKEVRVIKNSTGQTPFKKAALTGIYFGCKATDKTIDDFCNLLSQNGFGHTKRYRAVKHDADYRVVFQAF